MKKPTVFVCGLGRCGSSMTMQMLHAGGIATTGTFPDFEPAQMTGRPISGQWLRENQGRAIKWLDPHRFTAPRQFAIAVWLDRDPDQQTRSQLKFLNGTLGPLNLSRPLRRKWRRSLTVERIQALACVQYMPSKRLRFEEIIADPRAVAADLSEWLKLHGHDADPVKMAAAVLPRRPECRPDLSLEFRLIANGKV